LLSNAIKFSNVGGIIKIKLLKILEDKDREIIKITVEDTGIGMDFERV